LLRVYLRRPGRVSYRLRIWLRISSASPEPRKWRAATYEATYSGRDGQGKQRWAASKMAEAAHAWEPNELGSKRTRAM